MSHGYHVTPTPENAKSVFSTAGTRECGGKRVVGVCVLVCVMRGSRETNTTSIVNFRKFY